MPTNEFIQFQQQALEDSLEFLEANRECGQTFIMATSG